MAMRMMFCVAAIGVILSAGRAAGDESTPAKPPEMCTIRATIVTFDGLPYDDAKCVCTVRSHQNPHVNNGETSYRNVSGRTLFPNQRVLKLQMPACMVTLGVMLPGYAPAVVEPKEARLNEVPDHAGAVRLRHRAAGSNQRSNHQVRRRHADAGRAAVEDHLASRAAVREER